MKHRVQPDLVGRSRKRRALLVGGAVLGIGATGTLAAWTDDVWVLSSFTTSPFNVEAAVNPSGDVWRELDESPGGGLSFRLTPADNDPVSPLLPADSVYAPLNLRVERGETGGQVSLSAPPSGNGAFFSNLRLSLFAVAPGACNATETAFAPAIGAGTSAAFEDVPLTHGTGLTLPLVELPASGDAVGICFKVTLPATVGPEVAGGSTGDLVWNLKAEPVA